jgi:MurNAc alpha-1-phosphate uridylyltransferase
VWIETPHPPFGHLLPQGEKGLLTDGVAGKLDTETPPRTGHHSPSPIKSGMDRFPDVMILAAGLGKRMLPLTETTPKPLIKVAGKPLLDRVAALAHREGATRFVVNAHHHAEQMKPHVLALEASIGGTHFELSSETALLNTGGGVRAALPLLQTDPIFVMNADSLWLGGDTPMARMRAAYDGRIVLLCVHPFRASGFSRRSHDFCLAPDGEVTNDAGAPVIYAGTALIPRALIEAAPEGPFSLFTLFDQALDRGELRGVALGAEWLHVGDPAALAAAEAKLA